MTSRTVDINCDVCGVYLYSVGPTGTVPVNEFCAKHKTLAATRETIIEECAKVADYLYENGLNKSGDEALLDCANAIRALKGAPAFTRGKES